MDINNLPKICLTMIVKNEENVIERCLQSIEQLIDYWVIVDTGSTDKTKEIITNFFKDKNKRGVLVDHEWVNFSDGRNRAITEAEKLSHELNISDNIFGFWLDADEQIVYHDNYTKEKVKKSLVDYDARLLYASYDYEVNRFHRNQFYKLNIGWNFYGPIHEVLTNNNTNIKQTSIPIEFIHTHIISDGNSWTSQTTEEKYSKHAEILLDYVLNDDTNDPRWVFYLAQSYRDCGDYENAIKWYKKRTQMVNGYWEEIYFSKLMIPNLKSRSGEYFIGEILMDFIEAGKSNRFRMEHLHPVILHYQNNDDYETSLLYTTYAYNNYAGKTPEPNSTLFIDYDLYNWKIYELHAYALYYANKKQEAITVFRKLLKRINRFNLSEFDRSRILNNKKYFI